MKTKPETKKQAKTETNKPEQTADKTPIDDAEHLSAADFLEDLFKVFIDGDHRPATSVASKAAGSPVKVKIGFTRPEPEPEPEPEYEDLMDEDSPYSRIIDALQKKPKALTPYDALYDMVSSDVEILNDTQISEFERILVRLNGSVQYDLHDAIQNYGEALRSLRRAAEKLLAALDVDKESREADEADMKEEE